jgi:hypothetical protein
MKIIQPLHMKNLPKLRGSTLILFYANKTIVSNLICLKYNSSCVLGPRCRPFQRRQYVLHRLCPLSSHWWIIFKFNHDLNQILDLSYCYSFTGMLSACANPILYGLLNENFKSEFKLIFKTFFHKWENAQDDMIMDHLVQGTSGSWSQIN